MALRASAPLLVAVDIGGTKVAIAVAAPDGTVLQAARYPAETERGPDAIIARILVEAKRLLLEDGGSARAIGIACGGPLDRASGTILGPPNLPGWQAVPVGPLLSAALSAPFALDNDANAAALGELRAGAGRGFDDLVYVTISTGIGGGIVRGGRLVYGLGDAAGEVGHQTLAPDGPHCGCGNQGCLEALASGPAIARDACVRASEDPARAHRLLARVDGDPARLTAEHVASAAREGDPLAREVWERHALARPRGRQRRLDPRPASDRPRGRGQPGGGVAPRTGASGGA